MLSLGTTVTELEQKPFENGLGAARAALRRVRALVAACSERDARLDLREPSCFATHVGWTLLFWVVYLLITNHILPI